MKQRHLNWEIGEDFYLKSYNGKGKFNEFKISKTCNACPVQYDIFYNDKTYYARLRWGVFYLAKEPSGKVLFEHSFSDKWKGWWTSPSQEMQYLIKALEKIK
jgi:hypothetical protein